MKVFKYPLGIANRQTIAMPLGASILDIQKQDGRFVLWALTDPELPPRKYTIHIVGTGMEVPADIGQHIATVQNDGLVWHFFAGTVEHV